VLAASTATLATKAPGTVDVSTRILRHFSAWLAAQRRDLCAWLLGWLGMEHTHVTPKAG